MTRTGAVLGALLAAVSCVAQSQQTEQRALIVGRADSAPPRSTADILSVLDEYKPDLAQLGRLRQIVARAPPKTDDPVDLARFHIERSRAAGELGMARQQVEDLRKASELLPANNQSRRFSLTIETLVAESRTRDWANSLKRHEELPRLAQNDQQRLTAWSILTASRAQVGNLAGARKALQETQSLLAGFRTAGWWPAYGGAWEAMAERGRADVSRLDGKLAESEASNRRAIMLWKEYVDILPVLIREGRTDNTVSMVQQTLLNWERNNLAPVLIEQSKYAETEWLMRDSLKRSLAIFGRYSMETALTLVRLAQVVFEQGRFEEAAQLSRAAVEIQETMRVAPYATSLGEARSTVASALVEQDKFPEAVAEFEAIRKGLDQDPAAADTKTRGAGTAWIYALVRVGKTSAALEQARELYRQQLKLLGEHLYAPLEARGFLALALAADGKQEEAMREFRVAVPALLAAASERTVEEGFGLAKTIRLHRILHAYIELLGAMAVEGKPMENVDPIAEAFRIADVARGSTVQRALVAASARAAIRDPELAKLAREEQDAARRIGSLIGILVELLGRPPEKSVPTVITAMRKDIEDLRKRRVQLKREIEGRFPDYANLVDPKPVPLEAARTLLGRGEVLIVLYGTETRTFVWAVPREGAPRFHVAALGRTERDRLVATLRRALDFGDAPDERAPRFDLATAHKLYAELLAPLEPAWSGAENLLLVPHGSLGQLPFSLLVTAPTLLTEAGPTFESYRSVPWLVRRIAVTQLPSVNTLASLRSGRRAALPSKAFAGFGDPIFSPDQVALTASTKSMRVRSTPFADAQRLSSQLSQLAPLPDTAEEINSIALTVGASPTQDVYLGRRASEQNVKTTDLSDRRIVMFATHGLVAGDLDGLTQPALALSNPLVTGESNADGLLAMDEILGLKLNAEWVVLSACNTAAADGAGGEAISGLGRAFFYAGARALLVSNWPVETVSAKLLTTELFRRQAADPRLSRATALRQAMLHLMDNEVGRAVAGKPPVSYAHPMFWAPFSLVGDGGSALQ